jgi:hypothetical protein
MVADNIVFDGCQYGIFVTGKVVIANTASFSNVTIACAAAGSIGVTVEDDAVLKFAN